MDITYLSLLGPIITTAMDVHGIVALRSSIMTYIRFRSHIVTRILFGTFRIILDKKIIYKLRFFHVMRLGNVPHKWDSKQPHTVGVINVQR